jgi:hypothetical protein
VPWFNLGLPYKRQRRWEVSLRFNRKATELAADDQAGWCNLGIAATALRRLGYRGGAVDQGPLIVQGSLPHEWGPAQRRV